MKKFMAVVLALFCMLLCFIFASCNESEEIIDTGGITTTSDTDINNTIDIKSSEKYADYHLINTTISDYWKDIDDLCVSENETVIPKLSLCFTDANNITIYGQVLYEADPGVYSIERITYGSQDIECSHEMTLSPRLFDIYHADGITIVGNSTIDESSPLHYYLFIEGYNEYTYICNDIQKDDYELRFYTQDGKMFYRKSNYDYAFIQQDYKSFINAFEGASGNEFFEERGTLTFTDYIITFIPDYTMTAEEWYHSNKFIEIGLRDEYKCDTLTEFVERLEQEMLGEKTK